MTRRDQTRLLLASLGDTLPAPAAHPLPSEPGFVGGPLRALSCEDCLTNGFRSRNCQTCGGTGTVPDPRPDPYMRPGGFHDGERRQHDRRRDMEAEERRLARLLAVAAGAPDPEPTRPRTVAMEVAAAACGATVSPGLLAAGSYAELLDELGRLRERWPTATGCLINAFVHGRYDGMTAAGRSRADKALDLLARRMPARIRVPYWLEQQTAMRRQRTVAEMRADGWTAARVARALGVSAGKAKRLLRAAA